jgi:hypothetical protein
MKSTERQRLEDVPTSSAKASPFSPLGCPIYHGITQLMFSVQDAMVSFSLKVQGKPTLMAPILEPHSHTYIL